MTKKNWCLVFLLLGLGVVYAVWFTDWFHPGTLHITYASRRNSARVRHNADSFQLMFAVSPRCRLTEIKVVPLAAFQTNLDAVPVWHLVSDSNSVPLRNFNYGQNVGGMRLAIKGVHAAPLETNVTYRMFLTAGRAKGEHDFELK